MKRTIHVGILVVPGDCEASRKSTGVYPDEVQDSAREILAGLKRAYSAFEVNESTQSFAYQFEFEVTPSSDTRSIWTAGTDTAVSVPDDSHRSMGDAYNEALNTGLQNLAIVHPDFGGGDSFSPRLGSSPSRSKGRFLLKAASNVMLVERTKSSSGSLSSTAAHELVHFLGVADDFYGLGKTEPRGIFHKNDIGKADPRIAAPPELLRIHAAVQAQVEGLTTEPSP